MKKFLPGLLILLLAGVLFITLYEDSNVATLDSSLKDGYSITYEDHLAEKRIKKQNGKAKMDAPDEFVKMLNALQTPDDRTSPEYVADYRMVEYQKAKANKRISRSANGVVFNSRGPGNIAGRTRSVLIDPRDETGNTWLAGSVSGGVWRTTDGGDTWTHLTQSLPNLATGTVAASASNFDVIYVGTGEPFFNLDAVQGDGLFKSSDGGQSWSQIISPRDFRDMTNISRVIVHPDNENLVYVTGSSIRPSRDNEDFISSILRSTDGGSSWERIYTGSDRIDDIDFSPFDPSRMYASVLGQGVLRSEDRGDNWQLVTKGFGAVDRIEIAHSTTHESTIWASAEAEIAELLVSRDYGLTWQSVNIFEEGSEPYDFLGEQGWYDNIIAPHPFDENTVYVGGVNLFKFEFRDSVIDEKFNLTTSEEGTDYLSFVNFGGTGLRGGLLLGDGIRLEDMPDIEIRFGQGSQLAHRFTVNSRGAGVPDADYIYEDYVEIPFQIWDVTNDRQLMVSFRDQGEDGEFTLLPETFNGNPAEDSREYIFAHLVDYADAPDTSIGRMGGVAHEQLFFIWPVAIGTEEVDLASVDPGIIELGAIGIEVLAGNTTVLSDAYRQFASENSNLHPDQHALAIDITDEQAEEFRLLVGNDGGVYSSLSKTAPGEDQNDFLFKGNTYVTTQFYGADKAPGEDRYLGGMQDNSTWFMDSAQGLGAANQYVPALGGDGFEAVWNNRDPNFFIGSIQFNIFGVTYDGGQSFVSGSSGFGDVGMQGSPFLSKLTNARSAPDFLYSVGSSGIWYSRDFARSWKQASIEPGSFWTYVGSGTDVSVSEADYKVVWAGGFMGGMANDIGLLVSDDGGQSFRNVNSYDGNVVLGRISSIATHPTDRNTAYALFSFANRPKVLRTTDMGESWEDISGFGTSDESSTGFPDVPVHCLFVFPNNPNRIWAGTDIGIVESLDNGVSWNLLDDMMGAVCIWDMKVQDDQIVIATHGRGIWTASIEDYSPETVFVPVLSSVDAILDGGARVTYSIYEQFDSVHLLLNDEKLRSLSSTPVSGANENIGAMEVNPMIRDNRVDILAYLDGKVYSSLTFEFENQQLADPVTAYENRFESSSRSEDFYGPGFQVATQAGFDAQNLSLQTSHPHPGNTELYQLLKYPVIVENQILSYRDIAIIEPGDETDFFDFVVIEASADGEEWKSLIPRYDARLNEIWTLIYDAGLEPDSSMFVFHSVPLRDHFESGDTVLIRFRLLADPAVEGWGWLIDDFVIEDESTSTEPDVSLKAKMIFYPNPVSNELRIQAEGGEEISRVHVYDIQGKQLFSTNLGQSRSYSMDVSQWDAGIWLVQIVNKSGRSYTKRIVKTQ